MSRRAREERRKPAGSLLQDHERDGTRPATGIRTGADGQECAGLPRRITVLRPGDRA